LSEKKYEEAPLIRDHFSLVSSTQSRVYPGLILEGDKIEYKFQGGKIPFFCPKIPIFFKNGSFLKKNLSIGGAAAPLCPPGFALAPNPGICLPHPYLSCNATKRELLKLPPYCPTLPTKRKSQMQGTTIS